MSLTDRHEATYWDIEVDVRDARDRMRALKQRLERQQTRLAKHPPEAEVEKLEALEQEIDRLWTDVYALVACATGWRHSTNEVAAWCMRSVDMGAAHPMIGPVLIEDLMRVRRVPVAPLRERFEEIQRQLLTTMSPSDLAIHPESPSKQIAITLEVDIRYVPRLLGLAAARPAKPNAKPSMKMFIDYDQAVLIARALGMSPREAGI